MPLSPTTVRLGLLGLSFAVRHVTRALSSSTVIETRQSLVRSSEVEKTWGFGTFKASGQLLDHTERIQRAGKAEVDYPVRIAGEERQNADDKLVTKFLPVYLMENEVESITFRNRIYIDGEEVPVREVQDADDPLVSYWIADPDGFDDDIAAAEQKLADLGFPGASPYELRQDNLPAFVYEVYDELQHLRGLRDNFKWVYRIGAEGLESQRSRPGKSLFRIYLDRNTPGEADNGSSADRRAASKLFGPYSEVGSQNIGFAWALIEVYAFAGNAEALNSRLPNFQFVFTCPESNPARAFRWFATNIPGIPENAVLGIDDAATICDETITYPVVMRGDENEDKIVTSEDVLKVIYPWAVNADGTLNRQALRSVSTSMQDRALREWNNEFAGPENARPRYTFNGVITAGMADDSRGLFNQFAIAAGGNIAVVSDEEGNAFGYSLIAGSASEPVGREITDDNLVLDDRAGLPVWEVASGDDRRVGAVTAAVAQDRRNDYGRIAIRQVVSDYSGVAGYREQDIGAIPFKNDEMEARRIANLMLRKRSPYLARVTFTLGRGENWSNWRYLPGQRVRLRLSTNAANHGIYRIEAVQPDRRTFRVRITARQDPDSIYSDRFDSMLAEIGRAPRQIVNAPTDDLRISATAEERFVSVRSREVVVKLADDDPTTVHNPEFDRSPYAFEGTAAEGMTTVARVSGNFEPRNVVDLHIACASSVRSIKVEVAIAEATALGAPSTLARHEMRFNLTSSEVSAELFTRTLLSGANVLYLDPDATRIVVIHLTGYSEPGTDTVMEPVAGPVFVLTLSGREGPSMADLADYLQGSPVPTIGRVLQWGDGGWRPGEPAVLVDSIDDDDVDRPPGTLVCEEETDL